MNLNKDTTNPFKNAKDFENIVVKGWREDEKKYKKKPFEPKNIQYNVEKFEDLNEENKEKFINIIKLCSFFNEESLLREIQKYNTSVLDSVLDQFC